jgi:hypothetical protein
MITFKTSRTIKAIVRIREVANRLSAIVPQITNQKWLKKTEGTIPKCSVKKFIMGFNSLPPFLRIIIVEYISKP